MAGSGLCIDIPVAWITSSWWDRLGSAGQGVYVSGLAWSMSQGADGDLPRAALRFIAADIGSATEALELAVSLGRAERTDDGWRFPDWDGIQAQTPIAKIEANRKRKAANERAGRQRRKSGAQS